MKETLESIKEYWGKISRKTKIRAAVIAVIIIVGAVAVTLILNHKDYVVLFTGVNEEETTEILGKLQEMGVQYNYNGSGNIEVPSDVADSTRAQLAYDGYPKSGFTYDVFTANASGMTTDMEKQTYKLYELQNRIGATVRLFDGVKDAKVTIALEDEQKYVLDETEDAAGPSASVVVVMQDGGSPSSKQAVGIQRLVARSVPDMKIENVSVLDGSGIEVSSSSDADTSGDAGEEIAQIIETQISKKVVQVLGPFYGQDNIRVAAKGKVNMEKIVRESTTYTTPEKIDENDKTGIVSGESSSVEASGDGIAASGVAGTESNADVAQYAADADGEGSGYLSESETRDYLVDQIKEQGQIDPGVLEDLTVAVSINGTDLGDLTNNQVLDLVGSATGIANDDRREKITVVNAPFYEEEPEERASTAAVTIKDYLPYIIAGAAALIVLLVVLLIVLKRRRRKEDEEEETELDDYPVIDTSNLDLQRANATRKANAAQEAERAKMDILNMQNEKSRELRENVRDFADENPEISAQMIKGWLHGGEEVGRGAHD